jgi:hypothetical protein
MSSLSIMHLVLPLLRQETHTIPIVFVQVTDPVADGLVDDASSSRCSAARWPLGRSRRVRRKMVVPTGLASCSPPRDKHPRSRRCPCRKLTL